jgi:peroxiredoxin
MKMSKTMRYVLLVISILAAGYAGLRAGAMLRNRTTPVTTAAPRYPFAAGDSLPDVQLADSSGAAVHSRDLTNGPGVVVLFLDPTCDGCIAMAERWEQAIKDDVVTPDRVVGISRGDVEQTNRFRAERGLQFPVYADPASAFLKQHGVTTYPLEVVVGVSGKIQSISENSKADIDADQIRAMLNR